MMSVMLRDPRSCSLIASYAQALGVSLSPGQIPEGLAQDLYADNARGVQSARSAVRRGAAAIAARRVECR